MAGRRTGVHDISLVLRRPKERQGQYFVLWQDALVRSKILPNDGWKDISGFEDRFYVDRKNPRIVVELIEEEEG